MLIAIYMRAITAIYIIYMIAALGIQADRLAYIQMTKDQQGGAVGGVVLTGPSSSSSSGWLCGEAGEEGQCCCGGGQTWQRTTIH